VAGTLGAVASGLRALGGGTYEGAHLASEMGLRLPPSPGFTVLKELPTEPLPAPREGASLMESVRARGRLRVGFVPNQAPFSYFNARGELVGFDVEMAHALARELGVGVEFAPVSRAHFADALRAARVDVVMAGILVTTQRASQVEFSAPYLDETFAFLVPDYRRAEFSDAQRIRSTAGLRIAIPDLPYVRQLVEREFPGTTIVPMELAGAETFLRRPGQAVDAYGVTAERGSFITLLHPEYSVAVPHPLEIRLPLAYPVARHDVEMARFLSLWIDLKRKDHTLQALYDHWILGKDAKAKRARWSILHDVLAW
jgi:ABC-type amino acid transport substrate-binding protein